MPLFMMLSGYVSSKISTRSGNIMRRFEQLIVPSAFLFVICSVVNYSTNWWFLKSCFVCYVVWTAYYYLPRMWQLFLSLLVVVLFFPLFPHIPYVESWKLDFMLPFFGIGLVLHQYEDRLKKYQYQILLVSFITFAILWIFWRPRYIYYWSMPSWIAYFGDVLSYEGFKTIFYYMYRFFIGLFGSLTVITLFRIFLDERECKTIMNLGSHSIHIYIYCKASLYGL